MTKVSDIRFLRVVRHPENLPGQLEAIDRVLEGTEWKRIGYYPAPSRDIALQRLPGRGVGGWPGTIRFMLEAHAESECAVETYGGLGYLISGTDELEGA